jgi:hypothetical protein
MRFISSSENPAWLENLLQALPAGTIGGWKEREGGAAFGTPSPARVIFFQ